MCIKYDKIKKKLPTKKFPTNSFPNHICVYVRHVYLPQKPETEPEDQILQWTKPTLPYMEKQWHRRGNGHEAKYDNKSSENSKLFNGRYLHGEKEVKITHYTWTSQDD